MASLDEIRNKIKTTILTVPDVGVVHTYERFAKEASKFAALYDFNGQILGWNIRRLTRKETSAAIGIGSKVNGWRISGFMSLKDDVQSEIVFDNLVEAICEAFRVDETLGGLLSGGTVLENPNVAGIQVTDAGPVMFAGVLCHSARLELFTWENT